MNNLITNPENNSESLISPESPISATKSLYSILVQTEKEWEDPIKNREQIETLQWSLDPNITKTVIINNWIARNKIDKMNRLANIPWIKLDFTDAPKNIKRDVVTLKGSLVDRKRCNEYRNLTEVGGNLEIENDGNIVELDNLCSVWGDILTYWGSFLAPQLKNCTTFDGMDLNGTLDIWSLENCETLIIPSFLGKLIINPDCNIKKIEFINHRNNGKKEIYNSLSEFLSAYPTYRQKVSKI